MSEFVHSSIPLTDAAGWRSALAGVPHGFAHTVECCRAIERTSRASTRLVVLRRHDTQVVCPVSEREHDGYIDVFTPYHLSGFTGNGLDSSFEAAWRAFAQDQGWVAGYYAMHPLLPNDCCHGWDGCVTQNELYVLDLTRPVDELFSRIDRNRRRELRDFPSAGGAFVSEQPALVDFLVAEYPAFVRRVRAASVLSPGTLEALATAESTLLVGVAKEGIVEAVYLFGYTKWAGDCLLNVATPEGRKHSTSLLWHGMLELKRRGVPRLNLGGGVRRGDPVGLAKMRFGPLKVPFRSIRQIYRPDVFAELCGAAGSAAAGDPDYFPPYQRRSSTASPPG